MNSQDNGSKKSNIQVVDFFSGCGGTSCGLSMAGLDVRLGLDVNEVALETYKRNFPNSKTICKDIRILDCKEVDKHIDKTKPLLFAGCAPCQPFSKQNKNKDKDDPRSNLLLDFLRFISHFKPDYILMENVPGIIKAKNKKLFSDFHSALSDLGYFIDFQIVQARQYGVPQKRDRLLLLGSMHTEIKVPEPTHGPGLSKPFSTVSEWISGLPVISAGETCSLDPDHQSSKLSEVNLQRIRHTPSGGGREMWPEDLWLECHKMHKGHSDVYGRLDWNKPASGLTTRCISLSNGRFGHPSQDRAISVREAACLQTFPRDYKFSGSMTSKAVQIGNAVPPLLAKVMAIQVLKSERIRVSKNLPSLKIS